MQDLVSKLQMYQTYVLWCVGKTSQYFRTRKIHISFFAVHSENTNNRQATVD